MTAANLTMEGTFNQKRDVSVAVIDLDESQIVGDGSVVMVLPDDVLITEIGALVTTASGTASATVDVLVGTDVVADEIAVASAGWIPDAVVSAEAYRATGGEVTVKAGGIAPATGSLVCSLVIQYIELNKRTGEYTNFKA